MLPALVRSPWRLAVAMLGALFVAGAGLADTVDVVASTSPGDPQPVAAARTPEPTASVGSSSTALPTTTTILPTSTTAPPTTTSTLPPFDAGDRAEGWERRRGAAALERIDFDPASLGYELRFLPGRPGHYGMTYPNEQRIDVWVRPDQSLDLLTHVTAHELGHAVDLAWNDEARRAEYLELRGLGARPWFTCDGCTDFSTPAGDFAEVFARWAVGGTDFRSTLGPPPSDDQYAEIARFFAPPG